MSGGGRAAGGSRPSASGGGFRSGEAADRGSRREQVAARVRGLVRNKNVGQVAGVVAAGAPVRSIPVAIPGGGGVRLRLISVGILASGCDPTNLQSTITVTWFAGIVLGDSCPYRRSYI